MRPRRLVATAGGSPGLARHVVPRPATPRDSHYACPSAPFSSTIAATSYSRQCRACWSPCWSPPSPQPLLPLLPGPNGSSSQLCIGWRAGLFVSICLPARKGGGGSGAGWGRQEKGAFSACTVFRCFFCYPCGPWGHGTVEMSAAEWADEARVGLGLGGCAHPRAPHRPRAERRQSAPRLYCGPHFRVGRLRSPLAPQAGALYPPATCPAVRHTG